MDLNLKNDILKVAKNCLLRYKKQLFLVLSWFNGPHAKFRDATNAAFSSLIISLIKSLKQRQTIY